MEHELYVEVHLGNCHQIPAPAAPWEVFKTRANEDNQYRKHEKGNGKPPQIRVIIIPLTV